MSSILMLKSVLQYIEAHIQEDLTLKQLADEHFISLSHLHRLFSSVSNYSLKEYIKKRRITKASIDLVETKETITDIALKYGYQSYEGFSRAFKRLYNVSPQQFRNHGIKKEIFPKLEVYIMNHDKGAIYMISITNINEEILKVDPELLRSQYLICLDIDKFVSYNEQYGRDGGDIVIAEAARRIENRLLQGMKSFRVGGDEFMVIAEQQELGAVEAFAQNIIRDAEKPIRIKGQDVYFNMSIGIVKAQHNKENVDDIIEASRNVMILAKLAGRNCYKIAE